jgi:hypothetical protein
VLFKRSQSSKLIKARYYVRITMMTTDLTSHAVDNDRACLVLNDGFGIYWHLALKIIKLRRRAS